jgi:hypothetical protein
LELEGALEQDRFAPDPQGQAADLFASMEKIPVDRGFKTKFVGRGLRAVPRDHSGELLAMTRYRLCSHKLKIPRADEPLTDQLIPEMLMEDRRDLAKRISGH